MRELPSIRRKRRTAGFSLIEMLVAAALLAFIAMGLIPLFVRSIRDNETGSDFTAGSNGSKSGLEVTSQISFFSDLLKLPSGATELVVQDSWTMGDPDKIGDDKEGTWWPGAPTDKGRIAWRRETTTHEYSMGDLDATKDDFLLEPDEREIGTSDAVSPFTQLKEVEVTLVSESTNAMLGGGRRVSFRSLKGF